MATVGDETEPTPNSVRDASRKILVRSLVTVVVAVVGLAVALALAGGLSDVASALRRLEAGWLVVALLAEAVSYVLLAELLRRLVAPDVELGRRHALGLSLVVFGLGMLTPASPAEGSILAVAELRRRGLTTRRGVLALGFAEGISTIAVWSLGAVSVVVAVAVGHISGRDGGLLVLAAVAVLVTIASATYAVTRRSTVQLLAAAVDRLLFWRPNAHPEDRRAAADELHLEAQRMLRRDGQAPVLAILAMGSWIADAVALAATLAAAGVVVAPDIVLVAYTAGIVVSQVPALPAGLGLVEAAIPAVLQRFHVAYAKGLAGALGYRVCGTFAPALAGVFALWSLRVVRGRRVPATED
jgi:uncharacterized protein (TIRG00374 family)